MTNPLKVIVLNVDPGNPRPVFYAEPSREEEDDPLAPPSTGLRARLQGWLHSLRTRWRASEGKSARVGRKVWEWLHQWAHPDEPLLIRLRRAKLIELHHPPGLGADEARAVWTELLARSRRRHWFWFLVNLLIAPFSILLAILPGPNLVGFWFTYRALHHGLILLGLSRVRSGRIETRFIPNDLLDRPAGGSGDREHDPSHLVALGCDPRAVREFLRRHDTWSPFRPVVAPAAGG